MKTATSYHATKKISIATQGLIRNSMETVIFEQVKEEDSCKLRFTCLASSMEEASKIVSELNSAALDSTFLALPLSCSEKDAKVSKGYYGK